MGSPNTGFNTSLGQSGTVKVNGTKPPVPNANKVSLTGLPGLMPDQFAGSKESQFLAIQNQYPMLTALYKELEDIINGPSELKESELQNYKKIAENNRGKQVLDAFTLNSYAKFFILKGKYDIAAIFAKSANGFPLTKDEKTKLFAYQLFPFAEENLNSENDIAGRLVKEMVNDPNADFITLQDFVTFVKENSTLKDKISTKIDSIINTQKDTEETVNLFGEQIKIDEKISKRFMPTNNELRTYSEAIKSSDPDLAQALSKKANGETLTKKEQAKYEALLLFPHHTRAKPLWEKLITGEELSQLEKENLHVWVLFNTTGVIRAANFPQNGRLPEHIPSQGYIVFAEQAITKYQKLVRSNEKSSVANLPKEEAYKRLKEVELELAELIPDPKLSKETQSEIKASIERGGYFAYVDLPDYIEKLDQIENDIETTTEDVNSEFNKHLEDKTEEGKHIHPKDLTALKKKLEDARTNITISLGYVKHGKETDSQYLASMSLIRFGDGTSRIENGFERSQRIDYKSLSAQYEDIFENIKSILQFSLHDETITSFSTQREIDNQVQDILKNLTLEEKLDLAKKLGGAPKNEEEATKYLTVRIRDDIIAEASHFQRISKNPSLSPYNDPFANKAKKYDSGRSNEVLEKLYTDTRSIETIRKDLYKLSEKSIKDILRDWNIDESKIENIIAQIEANNQNKYKDNPITVEDFRQIAKNIILINNLAPKDIEKILDHPFGINTGQLVTQLTKGVFYESPNAVLATDLSKKLHEIRIDHQKEIDTKQNEYLKECEKLDKLIQELAKSTKTDISWYAEWTNFGDYKNLGLLPYLLDTYGITADEELDEKQGALIKKIKEQRQIIEEKRTKLGEVLQITNSINIAEIKQEIANLKNTGQVEEANKNLLDLLFKYGNRLQFIDIELWNDIYKKGIDPKNMGAIQFFEEAGLITNPNVSYIGSDNPAYGFNEALVIIKNELKDGTDLDKEITLHQALHSLDNESVFATAQKGVVEINKVLTTLNKILIAMQEADDPEILDNLYEFLTTEAINANNILKSIDIKGLKNNIVTLKANLDNVDPKLRPEIEKRIKAMEVVVKFYENDKTKQAIDFIRDKSKFRKTDWQGWWESGEGPKQVAVFVAAVIAGTIITMATAGAGAPFAVVLIASSAGIATTSLIVSEGMAEAQYQYHYYLDPDVASGDFAWSDRSKILKWHVDHNLDPTNNETIWEKFKSLNAEVITPYQIQWAQDFLINAATMGMSKGVSSAISASLGRVFATEAGQRFLARFAMFSEGIDDLPIDDGLRQSFLKEFGKDLLKEFIDELGDEVKEEILMTALLPAIQQIDDTPDKRYTLFASIIIAGLVGGSKGINSASTNSNINQNLTILDLKNNLTNLAHEVVGVEDGKIHIIAYDGTRVSIDVDTTDPNHVKITRMHPTDRVTDTNDEVINADLIIDREELLSELPKDVQDRLKNDYAFLNIPDNVRIIVSSNIPYAGVVNYGVDGKAESLTISEETLNNLKSSNPNLRLHGLDVLLHETTHTYQTGVSPVGLSRGDYVTRRAIQEIAAINAGRAKAYGTQAKNVQGAKAFRDKLKAGDIQGAIDTAIEHGLIRQVYIARYNAEYDRYLNTTRIAASNQAEVGTQSTNANNDLLTSTPGPNDPGLTSFLNQPQEVQDLAPKAERNATLISILDNEGGSTATVFNGSIKGSSEEVAIKVYLDPNIPPGLQINNESEYVANKWKQFIGDFNSEIEGLKLMDTLGLGPKFYGVVDVGGNPALAMEKINGVHLEQLTPEQVKELINEETIARLNKKLTELAKKGYYSDDIQFLIVTQDGNGRKKGDIVFIDLVGIEPIAKTNLSQDEAANAMIEPTEAMLRHIIQDSKNKDTNTVSYSSNFASQTTIDDTRESFNEVVSIDELNLAIEVGQEAGTNNNLLNEWTLEVIDKWIQGDEFYDTKRVEKAKELAIKAGMSEADYKQAILTRIEGEIDKVGSDKNLSTEIKGLIKTFNLQSEVGNYVKNKANISNNESTNNRAPRLGREDAEAKLEEKGMVADKQASDELGGPLHGQKAWHKPGGNEYWAWDNTGHGFGKDNENGAEGGNGSTYKAFVKNGNRFERVGTYDSNFNRIRE